jgi:hypothetical protein
MEEKTRCFALRIIEPILTEFEREVAQRRANGATEAEIEAMLSRIETTNRPVMDADQFQYPRRRAEDSSERESQVLNLGIGR